MSTDALGRVEQELRIRFTLGVLATDVAASGRGEDRPTHLCASPGCKVMISPIPMRGPSE